MPIVSGGGGTFNGGTLTKALAVAPTATTDPGLEVDLPVGAAAAGMDYLKMRTELGNLAVEVAADAADAVGTSFYHSDFFSVEDTASVARFRVSPGVTRLRTDATGSITLIDHSAATVVEVGNDGKLGFFAAPPVVKPTVAGAKLPADVVMASLLTALVALGLVTDTTT